MTETQGAPLRSWSRGKTTTDVIVLHESVTSSRAKTVAVLAAQGFSVHFIVDRDGSVTQHAPLDRQCAHAGGVYNRRSVGIEVVNRYYGSQGDEGEPDIQTCWAHKGWYILPTAVQCEAVWQLIGRIRAEVPTIPLAFPAMFLDGAQRFTWGRFPKGRALVMRKLAGIVAHHRVDHADGLFVEHYAKTRDLGHPPDEAYTLTVAAASSGSRVTVAP